MAKLTHEQLTDIVTKAALDKVFRAKLSATPQDAASEATGRAVILDHKDVALLATLSSELDRFVNRPIDPIDAKSWAIGICHIHAR